MSIDVDMETIAPIGMHHWFLKTFLGYRETNDSFTLLFFQCYISLICDVSVKCDRCCT